MATHDYVIDNQSASAFRTDLNGALQAILTQNSNATAPATTAANMIWYDTANNQIKKRNEANSAWIILGTIDEGAGTFTPSGGPVIASQAQAETGTNNTAIMTPLRTRNAFNATGNAPVYACRSWVSFNGVGTVSVVGSGNVSSITDNGTGDYTVNFTTAMPDANYSTTIGGTRTNTNTLLDGFKKTHTQTVNGVSVRTTDTANNATDHAVINIAVFR
jgi:hypothetical protein